MKFLIRICPLAVVVTLASAARPVTAQETRADEIAAAQAEKARNLHPYEPGTAERIADAAKRVLVETPNGFYPWLDSVYSGGGFTLGAGYRHFYRDRTFWDARGLYSAKNYKRFEASTDSLGLSHGRFDTRVVAGWRDATQVSFYGVGGDTSRDAKSNFRMQTTYVGGFVHARGPGRVVFEAGEQFEDYTLMSGTGTSPSIEHAFTSTTAPGLNTNPVYAHTTLSAGVDSRPAAGYARRGGLYLVSYESFAGERLPFELAEVEGVQHIPILRENWVISLHGAVRTTIDDNDTVPYFLMPSLGSGSTLRAYPSWRFRDRHSLLMSGEWRWIPSRLAIDMALFYDAGKVASRRDDLDFSDLKTDVGVGVRFHAPAVTPLRIDVAHGSEGFNVVFSGAAAF